VQVDSFEFSSRLNHCQFLARQKNESVTFGETTANEARIMNLPFELSSTGYLAQQFQTPVSKILDAASRLGIRASRLNGIAHFNAADVEKLRTALVSELQQREAASINQRSNIS